jgi:hypothetical protein
MTDKDQQIPELNEVVDVEQQLPELTDAVDLEKQLPELTETVNLSEQNVEDKALVSDEVLDAPIDDDEVDLIESDPEIEYLYQQVQELEQEAQLEHQMHNHPSEPEVAKESEQQLLLNASYQKLEMLIMEQFPPQIAGSLITLLEKNIADNKTQLLDDFNLLSNDELHELLEQLEQDDGF